MKKPGFGQRKFNAILIASSLELTVGSLLSLADSAIVGHIVGENGLTAMNGIMPLITASIFIGSAIAGGSALVYARAAGDFRKEDAYNAAGLSMLLSAAAGLLLMLAGQIGIPRYMVHIGASEQVRALTREYMLFFSLCLLISPLKDLFSSFVYTDGGEMFGAAASIADSVGNVIFSIPLGLRMGMRGIAFGTLISNLLSMLILALYFFGPRCSLRLRVSFSKETLLLILKSSINSDIFFLYLAVLGIICNRLVVSCFGEAYLPMMTVLYAAIEIGIILEGAGEAVRPMVSAYMGEHNVPAIHKLMRGACRTNLLLGLLLSGLFLVSAPWIPYLFDLDRNSTLCQACTNGLRIYALSCVPMSWLALYDSYWLYIGRQKLSFFSNALKYFLFPAFLSIVLSRLLGPMGLWLGFGLAPLLSLGILLLIGRSIYRNKHFPFLLEDGPAVFDCSLEPELEAVEEVNQAVDLFLCEQGVDAITVNLTKLALEEILLLTKEKNPGKRIVAECCVRVEEEGVCLVLWDSGNPFDVTDTDSDVSSLRAYVVSCIMLNNEKKNHMLNVGFNRTQLYFPFKE